MTGLRRLVLRVAAVFSSNRHEAELAREVRAHLQILEDQFVAGGISRDQAKNAARRAFGGVEQAKELHRDARSLRWLDSWWLELKLGARLLVRYPGLTLVGGCAMAFGVAAGATAFEIGRQIISPVIPLEDGDRIVGIRLRDAETTGIERRIAQDVVAWRTGLDLVDDVGAFRIVERNLAIDGGSAQPIAIAEISASGFTLARVAPLIGRTLTSQDEVPGAVAVMVIAHDLWRTRFASDPRVIGRVVRLGASQAAVVGVMPAGFGFPVAQSAWVPLSLRAAEHPPRGGPALLAFGRLADGVSLQRAQAALTTMGQQAAAASPGTHAHLRPEVLPYARSVFDVMDAIIGFAAAHVFIVMFVVLVCANVGALVFARAITRHGEITVRSALGATRGRIVLQLFAEALVLAAVAAAVGLAASRQLLAWLLSVAEAEGRTLPFWRHADLSPATIFYTCALTGLGAVVAGVVPALKVTGGRLESRLRQSTLGGSGLTFGGIWTVVIVAQVAVTVAFPAAAFFVRQSVMAIQAVDVGFPARQYLAARFAFDAGDPSLAPEVPQTRARATLEDVQRRLSADPLVAGVTFTDRLPRTSHPERPMELEPIAGELAPPLAQRVSRASVALNYFDVLGAPILAGRALNSSDITSGAAVIVNRSFVERVAGGRNPVGRRVRYASSRGEPASRWYEIVGVVKDLGTIHDDYHELAGIYHPIAPHDMSPVHVAVHVRGDPASFAPQLQRVAAAVDSELLLQDILPLDAVGASMWLEYDTLWRLLGVVSAIALLLSLAGIYSIMSFTVSRRTREIGVRVALGASRWRVTGAILARSLRQVSIGIAAGGVLVCALRQAVAGLSIREIAALVIYVAVMLVVCLLACIVPARRALRIHPTEALRAD